jgi:hypothetical protein
VPWVRAEGLPGLVWLPERQCGPRPRHACPDCFSCQQCAAERCALCCIAIGAERAGSVREPSGCGTDAQGADAVFDPVADPAVDSGPNAGTDAQGADAVFDPVADPAVDSGPNAGTDAVSDTDGSAGYDGRRRWLPSTRR